MAQLVDLKLLGNLNRGFEITINIASFGQIAGKLPPQTQLGEIYSNWQGDFVKKVETSLGFNQIGIDLSNCQNTRDELDKQFNNWLNSNQEIREHLLKGLDHQDDHLILISTTEESELKQLPFLAWQLIKEERYCRSEIALSPINFYSSYTGVISRSSPAIILAVFGSEKIQGSNTSEVNLQPFEAEIKKLASKGVKIINQDTLAREINPDSPTELSATELLNWLDCHLQTETNLSCYLILVKPKNLVELSKYLQYGCDIFSYVGHSQSSEDGREGYLYLPEECVKISLLAEHLKAARKDRKHPLELAIFTSCHGFGLAKILADVNIPYVIAMRETIPVMVAETFLSNFFKNFIFAKQPLHLAVRQARNQLEIYEEKYPGVQWLPQLFCHPEAAKNILTWDQLLIGERETKKRISLTTTIVTSVLVTFLLIILRSLGFLQSGELYAYDYLMRAKPKESADSRLLIVGVDDNDLREYGDPLPDEILALLLNKLKQYQPTVIGLDILRDIPVEPGHELLVKEYQNPDLVAICSLGNTDKKIESFDPPSEISKKQVAFVDLYYDSNFEDQDNKIRRYSLYRTPNIISELNPCYHHANYSFASLVAKKYLQSQGKSVDITGKNLQFASVKIKPLQSHSGGYQNIDARGNLIMINYRNTSQIAQQVTVKDILDNDKEGFNDDWVKDRVVLIGYTAQLKRDFHDTPYRKMPGVHLHAHVVSQIISAVENNRPLLRYWFGWGDRLWILWWSVIGGIIIYYVSKPFWQGVVVIISLVILSGSCLFLLIQGWWIPLLPSSLAIICTALICRSSLPEFFRSKTKYLLKNIS